MALKWDKIERDSITKEAVLGRVSRLLNSKEALGFRSASMTGRPIPTDRCR